VIFWDTLPSLRHKPSTSGGQGSQFVNKQRWYVDYVNWIPSFDGMTDTRLTKYEIFTSSEADGWRGSDELAVYLFTRSMAAMEGPGQSQNHHWTHIFASLCGENWL
jgi:hypothetical protein